MRYDIECYQYRTWELLSQQPTLEDAMCEVEAWVASRPLYTYRILDLDGEEVYWVDGRSL